MIVHDKYNTDTVFIVLALYSVLYHTGLDADLQLYGC